MITRSESLANGVLNREIGRLSNRGHGYGVSQLRYQGSLLSNLDFEAKSTLIPLPPAVDTAGLPIVAKFNKNPCFGNGQLLAVGGEEGVVTIASTENIAALENGLMDGSWRPRAHWSCHRNSIFDLAWAKNDSVLYTASGHQQVGLWDTDTARALAVAEGHDGSIKSISPLHLCEDVFASGARDGRMMLWDARCPGFSSQVTGAGRRTRAGTELDTAPVLSPVWVQDNAHSRPAALGSSRVSAKSAKHPAVTITSVAFLPYSYLLASAGAHDTVVKLWDLRMHGLPLCDLELPKVDAGSSRHCSGRASGHKAKAANVDSKSLPREVTEFACPTNASAVGVTHLAVSDSGDRLLVSCLDSQHHLFSISQLASGLLATWRAPPPAGKGTFYMRSAFSPCGNYILCGSRDAGAHIWLASDPQRPPIELPHEHEVTGLAWCGNNWSQVATCSDSGEVRLWTLNRLPARAARAADEAAPAMASHVTELDVGGSGVEGGDADGEQCHHLTHGAGPSAIPAARVPRDAANERRNISKPLVRRTVQLRLNLQPKPVPIAPAGAASMTPTTGAAVPPAPAIAADAGVAAVTNVVPCLAVVEAAADPASVHAELALDKFLKTGGSACALDGKTVPACAAAVRATALSSPVSSAPVQPATAGPSCARRAAMLPPVPIFSPAVNSWQQQAPRLMPEFSHDTPAAPSTATRRPAPAVEAATGGAGPSACGGLEAAMKNLAQVRTHSPARMLPQCDFSGDESGLDAFAPVHSAARSSAQHMADPAFGKPPLPPHPQQPAELPAAHSFPPNSGSGGLLAARAPAVSPRTTPVSFNRVRSRLGPFSPSRSSASSGSGPFSNGLHSGGNSNGASVGTPTGGQRYTPGHAHHQPPQGVVDQILRNSPRFGSRTGHASGASGDALLSPRFRLSGMEGLGCVGEVPVPRRLFTTDAEADDQLHDGVQALAAGSGQGAPARLTNGADIVEAVDSLLQQAGFQASAGQTASPTPRLSMYPVVYDIQDGQDVGPALRYRAAHPDDLGPYIDFSFEASGDRGGSGREPQLLRFMPDTGGLLFALDGLTAMDITAGPREVQATDRDRSGEQVGDWLIRQAGGSEGGIPVSSAAVGDVAGGDDSDSYWDFDPYGDKENTPPPEPLPTSSASAGGSGLPFASPSRRNQPEDDQPLPLPLLEPASSTPTRAAATVATAPFTAAAAAATLSVGTPSALRWARLTTPFAAAHPIAAAAGFGSSEVFAIARPEHAPSLHGEPTVSEGIAPSGTGGTAAGSLQSGGGSAGIDEWAGEMPSFRPGGLSADSPAALVTLSGSSDGMGVGADAPGSGPSSAQAGHRRSVDGANEAGSSGGGDGWLRHHEHCGNENLTPTKRPRRAYSSSDDQNSAGDRSPSPTRRVRSSGILSGPAPTPSAKHRLGGAYAAAMASPAVRSGRHGGTSRLAPAPGAGYLVTAAAVAAAGIGSESPALKVGTVPRTGGRHTAASAEFFRRRDEEERSHAMMSPFGFGMFAGAAETPGGGGGTAIPRTASRLAHGTLGTLVEACPRPGSRGMEGDGRREAHSAGRQVGLPGDEAFGPMEKSVRSLSCVFETQTQSGNGNGTQVVPYTYPAEEEERNGVKQTGWQGRSLAELLALEECTVASPGVPPYCSNAAGATRTDEGDEGGYFEPGEQHRGDGPARQGTFHFGSAFGQDARQQQSPRNRFGASGYSAFAPLAAQALLVENSRSIPVRPELTAETGEGGRLQTAWSGHGASFDRGPQLFGAPGLGFSASGQHVPAQATDMHGQMENRSNDLAGQQRGLSRGFPSRLEDPVGGVFALNSETAAADAQQQQQQQPGPSSRRPRQMTLQEIWGTAQRHPTPSSMRPTGPVPLPPSRALGPTGLASPRYFR